MSDKPSTKQAVGVQFTAGGLPTVILKSSGAAADQVLREAGRHGDVEVVRDSSLAAQLYRVPIDQPVPRELFPVMAVVLIKLLELDQKMNMEKTA